MKINTDTKDKLFTLAAILGLSTFCRVVSEIGAWRPAYTWLPLWMTDSEAWGGLDGYHLFSNGVWLVPVLYIVFSFFDSWQDRLKVALGIFVAQGFVFDLFYHVIFIYPEVQDYYNSLIGQILGL